MRVPLSWLHELVETDLGLDELSRVLTMAGLVVEDIHRPSAEVRGVVVAEVLVAEPVPDTKLTRVELADGDGQRQVMCGASNFDAGDRVALAVVGATLPGPAGAPLEIGQRRMLGGRYVSDGMICSQRELGVGDEHKGIWVLDADAPVGADVGEWLGLDETILDLEVTPDRGYALSMIGVARDVAAMTGARLRPPVADLTLGDGGPGPTVPVALHDLERCPRFDARTIANVRVGPAPARVQRRLAAAGMRPRSNVVDATNLVLLELGNPIHAYDLSALAGPRIDVRVARAGERLRTLDGVDRALDPDDLVIADADRPVALAGVMGGADTEVSDATTTVLLEVANFSARTVLRSARRHLLATEGAKRWERGVPPETAPIAAARCAALIVQLAGGTVTAHADHYPAPASRPPVTLRPARAAATLGLDLDSARQQALLARIDCAVRQGDGEELSVMPPPWRPDLRIEEDLYEEIARVEGYDRIPVRRLPSTGIVGGRTPEHEATRAVRRALAGGGWTEVMPFPFISEAEIDALRLPADDPRRQTIGLVNPLSQEEAVLRTTLFPGLLRVLRRNVNRQVGDVAIFEAGAVFLPPSAALPGAHGGPAGTVLPAEPQHLGIAACGAFARERHDRAARPVDLADLLGAFDLARRAVGRPALDVAATDEAPFHPGRAARLRLPGAGGAKDLGVVGELHPRVIVALDLPPGTLAGELRLDLLVAGGFAPGLPAVPSALPGLRFDVAVAVGETVPAATVAAAVTAGAGARLTGLDLFDEFRGPQLGVDRKSLAYRVRLDAGDQQLTDADEAAAIEAIAAAVAAIGGELRR